MLVRQNKDDDDDDDDLFVGVGLEAEHFAGGRRSVC